MAETLTKPNTNSPDASGDGDKSRGRSSAAQENLQGLEKVFIPYEGFLGTSATKEQLRRSLAEPVQTAPDDLAAETSFLDAMLGTSMLEPPIERHAEIMSDPRFSQPANAPTSSRIVNRMHQTYGNGHVQRVVDLVQAIQDEGLSGEEVSADIEQTIARKRGTGKPLERGTRSQMESLFSRDFSDVSIHTDSVADSLAKALQAKAFTAGSDIFFREGAYEPGSESGKKLLGHELTHVAQQGISQDSPAGNTLKEGAVYSGQGVMQRQPANKAELRKHVQGFIRILQSARVFYSEGGKVDEPRLQRVLNGWMTGIPEHQKIIATDLDGDAALLARLRSAYQAAVNELINAASKQLGRTTHDLYQSNRGRIHEWGWPEASTDPGAHTLSGALPEAERRRIRVVTRDLKITNLHNLFSTKGGRTTVPLPAGVAVRYAGAIATELQHGLCNVAGMMVPDPLSLNSTMTLALDLKPYGGDFDAYRFTYLQRGPAQALANREVLIERLGAIGIEGLTAPQRAAQKSRFVQHGFRRGYGWSKDEFEALLMAIAQIPDNLLTPVDGLTFNRARQSPTDPDAGGDYNPNTHVITMYDRGFGIRQPGQALASAGPSLTRFGTPGAGGISTDVIRSVAHEIGHALDLRPLRLAWTTLEQAQQALRSAFQQYENPPGSGNYNFPNTMQAQMNTLQQQITQAEQALTQARSASDYRYQLQAGAWDVVEGPAGAGNNAFRLAAQQDGGVRITQYSNREWQEYFAESFTLYITNRTVLQQLRPNVFAFFVANFPR